MEYVILDIYWNRVFNKKEMGINISQIAAIHIDENLHTVSSFYRLEEKNCKTAKQVAYMMDIGNEAIMDLESCWEDFKQWLPEDAVFLVWDPELPQILQHCNNLFPWNPIRARFFDLKKLQMMMFPICLEKTNLNNVMTSLGLTCEKEHMISALYCVQCVLRLYRKLWKEGCKFYELKDWKDILQSGNFKQLQNVKFFRDIISKNVHMECNGLLKEFCDEKNFVLRTKGTEYEIYTAYAVWKFDLRNYGEDLIYIPKRCVQIPHYDMQIKPRMQDMVDVLLEIISRIKQTEERLKFGVGSREMETMLEKIWIKTAST